MRLHRFYIEDEIRDEESVKVSKPHLLHQWRKVLRFKEGDFVVVFNGDGFDYECKIEKFLEESVYLGIVDKKENKNIPKNNLVLHVSLIKKDNLEWVLEKGTELGVSRFVLVVSERSEKKSFNLGRARKIILEASEQSGRSNIPEIGDPVSLESAISSIMGASFALHPNSSLSSSLLPAISYNLQASVFIGPEGGWSPRELELFEERKISIVSLGSQILRAETAAIAVASIVLLN